MLLTVAGRRHLCVVGKAVGEMCEDVVSFKLLRLGPCLALLLFCKRGITVRDALLVVGRIVAREEEEHRILREVVVE